MKALKISEVGYLSDTVVRVVKFYLWLGSPFLKKKKKSLVIKAISQKRCEICVCVGGIEIGILRSKNKS